MTGPGEQRGNCISSGSRHVRRPRHRIAGISKKVNQVLSGVFGGFNRTNAMMSPIAARTVT
jgi:hypothetical protein